MSKEIFIHFGITGASDTYKYWNKVLTTTSGEKIADLLTPDQKSTGWSFHYDAAANSSASSTDAVGEDNKWWVDETIIHGDSHYLSSAGKSSPHKMHFAGLDDKKRYTLYISAIHASAGRDTWFSVDRGSTWQIHDPLNNYTDPLVYRNIQPVDGVIDLWDTQVVTYAIWSAMWLIEEVSDASIGPAFIRKSSKQNQFTVARYIPHNLAGGSKGIQYDNIDPTLDDAGVPVTLAIWGVYLESVANQGMMFIDQIASDTDDGGTSLIRELNSDLSFRVRASTADGIAVSAAVNQPVGKWFHVCGVFDGDMTSGFIQIYINGSPEDSTPTAPAGTRTAAPGSHSFGGREATQNRGFGGALAGAARWTRALTPGEIQLLAQGLHPLDMHPQDIVLCPNFMTLENMAPGAKQRSKFPNFIEYGNMVNGPPLLRSPKRTQSIFIGKPPKRKVAVY